jgi:hypothetical protein
MEKLFQSIARYFPALKGDLYSVHSLTLEDKLAVNQAEIPVENINGAILLLSGVNDDQWPATAMSDQIIRRLDNARFTYSYEHIKLDGGHIAPLNHFDKIFYFLDKNLK